MADPSAHTLNDSQKRHLLAALTRADELLRYVEGLCEGVTSPFSRERPDLAPEEKKLLRSFASLARSAMIEACDRVGVERPQPSVSARWSAETALHFVDISFADLGARSMRGYGTLSDDAARELDTLADALQSVMQRAIALLNESRAGPSPVRERTIGDAELASVQVRSGEIERATGNDSPARPDSDEPTTDVDGG